MVFAEAMEMSELPAEGAILIKSDRMVEKIASKAALRENNYFQMQVNVTWITGIIKNRVSNKRAVGEVAFPHCSFQLLQD